MKIRLVNIQSFVDVEYDFPDAGLVQIVGDNSNGKSILEKVLKSIATLGFVNQAERDSLIRDGELEGKVYIEYKGKGLLVKLNRDRNLCVVSLMRKDGQGIARTIREGGLSELIEEFGFRTYGKKTITLQLHETFGIMPFVNTGDALNYEIVDSVTTDSVAQSFLTNFKEITYKQASELKKTYKGKIDNLTLTLNNIAMYDYVAYEALLENLRKIYKIVKNLKSVHLEKIIAPPKVKYIDVQPIKLEKIKHVTFIPRLEKPVRLTDTLKRIQDYEQGVCPTCGRPFKLGDLC